MALYKATGLALRRTNLGEADRIITFIGTDGKKFRAVARGVRKIRSRMAGHVELFSVVELGLAQGRNLDVITGARLVRSFDSLSQDYRRIGYAHLFAEMADRLTGDDQVLRGGFELLTDSLAGLEEAADPLSDLTFRLRLLALLGYAPQLTNCVRCHQLLDESEQWLNVEHGGLSHGDCRDGVAVALRPGEIKLWRLVLGTSTADLRRVGGAVAAASASLEAAQRFYDHLFGSRFRAAELIPEAAG